jgi:hypothetical protein
MNKIIHPCDVPMWDGKKYPMFCKIEFKGGNLSISGVIGPRSSGNAKGGCGQIDMEFDHQDKTENDSRYDNLIKAATLRFTDGWNLAAWYKFLHVWHVWHLNDMKSNCEHQEAKGITYNSDPNNVCDVCGYEIGTAWLKREVPADVVKFLFDLPESDREPAWL